VKVIACPLKAECAFSSTRCFPANGFLGVHEKHAGAFGHVHQLQADIFDVFSKRPRKNKLRKDSRSLCALLRAVADKDMLPFRTCLGSF